MSGALSIVVLAAGQGTRMQSSLPKVLHALSNKPLIAHVLDTAFSLSPQELLIVHGFGSDRLKAFVNANYKNVTWVEQRQQLGTGHAVQQALPCLDPEHKVLVLYADVPLVGSKTLTRLVNSTEDLSVLTVTLDEPQGYGRIVRASAGHVLKIVEQKDATEQESAIKEVNTGILCAASRLLHKYLPQLHNHNAQKEFYLTDLIEMAVAKALAVNTAQPEQSYETRGVNSPLQLAALERQYQKMSAQLSMNKGLYLRDPDRFDVRGELSFGKDVKIDVNVVIEGRVCLGDNVEIGPFTYLKNTRIESGTQIKSHCHIEDASIASDCKIGPYARIRPGTLLASGVAVGNFVEIKNTQLGVGTKVNHLSYLGDAEVGDRVNIGAGTITCNYDGANKHKTRIESGSFIGSNTALIAPVCIGQEATVGAGSAISKDVAPDTLAIARGRQVKVPGWKRPIKDKEKDV